MRQEQDGRHVAVNRAYWDGTADDWVAAGERAWSQAAPSWGIWGLPEAQLHLLPGDMTGLQAVELGCGTGYVSAWMARRGAAVTALDTSARQLDTAHRLHAMHGGDIRFLQANAEQVPVADAQFDFAISEYGAAIWCDPAVWIPEAQRLLKPGGELVFLGSHPLAMVCTPLDGDVTDTRLHRPWFDMQRFDWQDVPIDPGGIEFNLTHADWFSLFRASGFEVLRYLELQAPADAAGKRFATTAAWARQWPVEQVWHLRKAKDCPGASTVR